MDKLDQIFDMQKDFMELIGTHKIDINRSEGQDLIRNITFFTTEELFEAMNMLKKKPWRKSAPNTNKDKFRDELIDAFHFFIELLIVSGISAEDLFHMYFVKMKENVRRQREGY